MKKRDGEQAGVFLGFYMGSRGLGPELVVVLRLFMRGLGLKDLGPVFLIIIIGCF